MLKLPRRAAAAAAAASLTSETRTGRPPPQYLRKGAGLELIIGLVSGQETPLLTLSHAAGSKQGRRTREEPAAMGLLAPAGAAAAALLGCARAIGSPLGCLAPCRSATAFDQCSQALHLLLCISEALVSRHLLP